MKTIKLEVVVDQLRKLSDDLYQLWVQVGDYTPCIYMKRQEVFEAGLIDENGELR